MEKRLYYVVELGLQEVGDVKETSGLKHINVYYIDNNKLIKFFELECQVGFYTSEEEIQDYLDDNGCGDDEYEFIQL